MTVEQKTINGLVVDHAPGSGAKMVFVHGASGGSWYWENFMNYFSQSGYDCYAVNLRGHPPNPAIEDLGKVTLKDYAEDVRGVLDALGEPAILVGHSMGGAIGQLVATQRQLKALVMVASGPVAGVKFESPGMDLWFLLHILKSIPAMIRKKALKPGFKVISGSVLNKVDPAYHRELFNKFVPESGAVGVEILKGTVEADISGQQIPKLVIGGTEDKTSVISMQRDIAKQQRADLIEVPDHAHMLMLESGWESVAEQILDWVRQKVG